MKRTLEEAEDQLRRDTYENTGVWRGKMRILRQHNVHRQFQALLDRGRKRYKTRLLKKRRKKVKFLKTKYRPKTRIIPDEIDGIIIRDQEIPENFSTEPRVYVE